MTIQLGYNRAFSLRDELIEFDVFSEFMESVNTER